jgi:hypothetical protein
MGEAVMPASIWKVALPSAAPLSPNGNRCQAEMKTLSATDIPRPSRPSRCLPGKSQEEVARALQMRVEDVARIERIGLLKCRRGFAKLGLTMEDFAAYFLSAASRE